jgi:hypothetical protein
MAEGVFGVERDESWLAGWAAGRASRVAELAVLRAQRDAALALCDHIETETAKLHTRGWNPYVLIREVRAALGVQPEPDNG